MDQVIADLQKTRKRVRTMLVVQRLSIVIALLVVAALLFIGLDLIARLPAMFRLVLLLAMVLAAAGACWKFVGPAIRFRPTLTQMALRLERQRPGLAGRLASSIEFVRHGLDLENQLAAGTIRDTRERLLGEHVGDMVRTGPTLRNVGMLAAAAVVVVAIGISSPSFFGTGAQRLLLPFSDAAWPARTGVQSLMDEIVGDNRVHPRQAALTLRGEVTKGDDDQRVEAMYRLRVDGSFEPWKRIVLTHQRDGVHERLVDTDAETMELYFETDDARSDVERIELVPAPAVVRASISVTPPAYAAGAHQPLAAELGTGDDSRAVTQAPSLLGSSVHLRLQMNKALPAPDENSTGQAIRQWLASTFGWEQQATATFAVDETDDAIWHLRWTLDGTTRLSLQLEDNYGLGNRDAISYRVEAVKDRVPDVSILDPDADQVVLPTAVIALTGAATDDVALSSLYLQAVHQPGVATDSAATSDDEPDVPRIGIAWSHNAADVSGAQAQVEADLDLGTMTLQVGDSILVTAVATDAFELDGLTHAPIHSAVRRFQIISELDLATQLRRELNAIRQNAIRIESMQTQLQEAVREDGMQPGVARAQAQIGQRLAEQRDLLSEIDTQMQRNRLEDEQLEDVLDQSRDMLDFAGRASNEASRAMGEQTSSSDASESSDSSTESSSEGSDGESSDESQNTSEQSGESSPGGEQSPAGAEDEQEDAAEPDEEETAAPEDVPVVEAQQEVREELADLIELLDRDEDTWVMTRRIEDLLEQQQQLEEATAQAGQETVGQSPESLSEDLRSELERIAQRQRDLAEEVAAAIEEARDRAEAIQESDASAASGMRTAAETGEQEEVQQNMERASEDVAGNRMQNAQQQQEMARETLERMLEDIEQTRQARAEELVRQLASLIESIQRLIEVQEGELIALARAEDTKDFSGRDRAMIRLSQNTTAVSSDARQAGQESRRIARLLDRAADAQGDAVSSLRAIPVAAEDARVAEEHALELLNEAITLAEEVQQQAQDDKVRQEREALIASYRALAEQQVAVRLETLPLSKLEELDRRQLVHSRRLGSNQRDVQSGLRDVRATTSDVMDSPLLSHVHALIDDWAGAAADELSDGAPSVNVTDAQAQVIDSIGRIIAAIEESVSPPEEFVADQQGGSGEQEGGEQQAGEEPLIPPITELRLLRSLQEQIYETTRQLDERSDLDDAVRRRRLRSLGDQQRKLLQLGEAIVESMSGDEGGGDTVPVVPPDGQPQEAGD